MRCIKLVTWLSCHLLTYLHLHLITFLARLLSRFLGSFFCCLAWLELEADLTGGGIKGEVGGEGAFGAFGNEAGKEVGLAFLDQLNALVAGDLTLEDGT